MAVFAFLLVLRLSLVSFLSLILFLYLGIFYLLYYFFACIALSLCCFAVIFRAYLFTLKAPMPG